MDSMSFPFFVYFLLGSREVKCRLLGLSENVSSTLTLDGSL